MRRDDRVFLMGEDVGRYGGSFGVSLGLLEEFGPERIRDAPLSESAFVGAGIGAALGGLRPIVEVMTVNFALLALDQLVNTAATLHYMSGGQFSVPLVVRMTSGAGRQLAAQHSHSLGELVRPCARIAGAGAGHDRRRPRHVVAALQDPDPVIFFEHGSLYNVAGPLDPDEADADIARAAVRRPGSDITIDHLRRIVAQDNGRRRCPGRRRESVRRSSTCASCGRSTEETVLGSVRRTHRAVIVDEEWKTQSVAAEVSARIAEEAFYDLDAPVARVCSAEVPMPYARHLELAALPSVERIVEAASSPSVREAEGNG